MWYKCELQSPELELQALHLHPLGVKGTGFTLSAQEHFQFTVIVIVKHFQSFPSQSSYQWVSGMKLSRAIFSCPSELADSGGGVGALQIGVFILKSWHLVENLTHFNALKWLRFVKIRSAHLILKSVNLLINILVHMQLIELVTLTN